MRIDPKPIVIGNNDETYSRTGKKDFDTSDQSREIITIGSMKAPERPRSIRSKNNSIT